MSRILSTGGRGCVYPSMHWGRHPLPSACWDTQTPLPPGRHPLGRHPPSGHCSGRYASYWNAFLFHRCFTIFTCIRLLSFFFIHCRRGAAYLLQHINLAKYTMSLHSPFCHLVWWASFTSSNSPKDKLVWSSFSSRTLNYAPTPCLN